MKNPRKSIHVCQCYKYKVCNNKSNEAIIQKQLPASLHNKNYQRRVIKKKLGIVRMSKKTFDLIILSLSGRKLVHRRYAAGSL